MKTNTTTIHHLISRSSHVALIGCLLALSACGRTSHQNRASTSNPPSGQKAVAISEVNATASVNIDDHWMYFHNVNPGDAVVRQKVGNKFVYCDSFLPGEESSVSYYFGEAVEPQLSEDLQTLSIENPLTLFSLKNLKRRGEIIDPDMPLAGVWEGVNSDPEHGASEKFVLQIQLGKEGYEFQLKKTCSAEMAAQ